MPKIPEKKKLTAKQRLALILACALVATGAGVWGIFALAGGKTRIDSYAYYQQAPDQMNEIRDAIAGLASSYKALKIFIYSDRTYRTDGVGKRVFYTYLDEEGTEMVTNFVRYNEFFTNRQTELLKELFNKTLVKDIYFTVEGNGYRMEFNEEMNPYGFVMATAYVSKTPEDENLYFGTYGLVIVENWGDNWYFLRRFVTALPN